MKIEQVIYEQILQNQRIIPPETGGILGGCNNIICANQYDKGVQTERKCSYTPNVKMLNEVIRKWHQKNILLMGIYHTHFFDIETLSEGDKKYIKIILKSMPEMINQLYFPLIIMPKRTMLCYVAKIKSGKVVIKKDKLEIVKKMEIEV